MVKVPASITKTKKSRVTFFSKEVTPLLKPILKRLGNEDRIFFRGKNPSNISNHYQLILIKYLERIGLDQKYESGRHKITTHSFRAFFITKVSSRVSVGNLSINAIDVTISQDITGIIIDKSQASSEYFYWYLKNKLKILISLSQGTTIQGFTRKELSKFSIILPPLLEQQKIASILSGVNAVKYNNAVELIILRMKFTILLILFTTILYYEFYNAEKNIHHHHNSR